MMRVSEYCKRRKIRIRVYPNIAQNSSPIINYDVFNSFFIRPEDQIQYEGLIDVLEFYGDLDKQEVYLSIYRNDQEWGGAVSDIIIGYIGEVMNNAVVPTFGQKRTHCRKECIKPDGESCHICEEAYELAKAINEKGLEIEGMEKLPKNWRDKKRAKKILKKFIKNDRTEFENLLGENFKRKGMISGSISTNGDATGKAQMSFKVKGKNGISIGDITDGRSVSSITEEYYLSTSKTELLNGSWSIEIPEKTSDTYIWTRSKIVYYNPTETEYTTPILDNSMNNAVSKGSVTQELNSELTIDGNYILIKTGKLILDTDQLKLDAEGHLIIDTDGLIIQNGSATFSGDIVASSGIFTKGFIVQVPQYDNGSIKFFNNIYCDNT